MIGVEEVRVESSTEETQSVEEQIIEQVEEETPNKRVSNFSASVDHKSL